jgi:hypothetical protein
MVANNAFDMLCYKGLVIKSTYCEVCKTSAKVEKLLV